MSGPAPVRPALAAVLLATGLAIGLPSSEPVLASGAWPGGFGEDGLPSGTQAPAFAAVDLDGAAQQLTQYQGSLLVLHFWATWCPYCRGEIPKLKIVRQAWASRGVRVLAVSVDADPQALKRFVAQAALPYPVIADLEAHFALADAYRVSGIPITYLIGPDGRIAERLDGAADILGAVERLRP